MEEALAALRTAWPGPPAALGFAAAFAAAAAGFSGRGKWLKALGLFAALAAVWVWLRLVPLPAELRGANRATLAFAAGVALLLGAWLFLAGRRAADWLAGFALCGLAAAALLFAVGAKALAGLALMLHGATWFLAARYAQAPPEAAERPAGDLLSRGLAAPILAAVLALALLAPTMPTGVPAPALGWRELAARPTVPLAAGGALLFAGLLCWRLAPPRSSAAGEGS